MEEVISFCFLPFLFKSVQGKVSPKQTQSDSTAASIFHASNAPQIQKHFLALPFLSLNKLLKCLHQTMLDCATYTPIGKLNPFFNKCTLIPFIDHGSFHANFLTELIQNDSNPLPMLRIQNMIHQLKPNDSVTTSQFHTTKHEKHRHYSKRTSAKKQQEQRNQSEKAHNFKLPYCPKIAKWMIYCES